METFLVVPSGGLSVAVCRLLIMLAPLAVGMALGHVGSELVGADCCPTAGGVFLTRMNQRPGAGWLWPLDHREAEEEVSE